MKFDNKILAIIFFGLLALFLFRKFMTKPEVRSIREVLVEIDSTSVDKLILKNKSNPPIELVRSASGWTALQSGVNIPATNQSVNGLLSSLIKITPMQLVSKNRDKWADYEVDDINGKQLEIYSKGKMIDAFYAGRFNFNQNNRTAKSYIRKSNEDDVYAVDGFMSMAFDKSFNDFRNKRLFPGLAKESIKGIGVQSNLMTNALHFLNDQWLDSEGAVLDSTKVATYISSLVNRQSNDIDLEFNPTMATPLVSINLSDVNNSLQAAIKIYQELGTDKPFVYHSSLNPDIYFRSDSTGLFKGMWLDLVEIF